MNQFTVTHRGTVYPWQCDQMGHMNVMWYSGKFDEASWQLIARLGLTRAYMQERNCVMAAVQQDITYKRELVSGDIVTIRSRVKEIGQRTIRFFHEMKNDGTGELAATTDLIAVHMDRATRRACPFPHDLVRRMSVNMNEPNPDIDITQHITQDAMASGPVSTGWVNSASSIKEDCSAN